MYKAMLTNNRSKQETPKGPADEFSAQLSKYSTLAVGGITGALAGFESSQAELIVTPSAVSLSNNPGAPPAASFDLNGDLQADVGVLVFSASFATAQGVNGAALAGSTGGGGFFYPTALQPGDLVSSGLTFGANSLSFPNSFGTMANSFSSVGNWTGGNDAYLGVTFTAGTDQHYGWVHVVWDPSSDTLSVDQFAYESVAGAPAGVIPEPSSLTLLALGSVALLRRRRK